MQRVDFGGQDGHRWPVWAVVVVALLAFKASVFIRSLLPEVEITISHWQISTVPNDGLTAAFRPWPLSQGSDWISGREYVPPTRHWVVQSEPDPGVPGRLVPVVWGLGTQIDTVGMAEAAREVIEAPQDALCFLQAGESGWISPRDCYLQGEALAVNAFAPVLRHAYSDGIKVVRQRNGALSIYADRVMVPLMTCHFPEYKAGQVTTHWTETKPAVRRVQVGPPGEDRLPDLPESGWEPYDLALPIPPVPGVDGTIVNVPIYADGSDGHDR